MSAIGWLVTVAVGLPGLLWLAIARGAWRLRELPALGKPRYPDPDTWPSLSVLVAARNEAHTIEPALASLLAQDYPRLEIVIVDDRSTDGTGGVIDRMALADSRVTVVHVQDLAPGWLGKVHALQRGLDESRGELVLLTDADVHFAPGTLRTAVALLAARRLDHLAAIPQFETTGSIVDVAVAQGVRALVTVVLPPGPVNEGRNGAFFGVGAFNLFRRDAFAKTPGFEYLRMETADDVGVGMVLGNSGAACGVVSAFDLVSVEWHRTMSDVFRGSEKIYATLADCRAMRLLLMAVASAWVDISPLAGAALAALAPSPLARAVGGTVVASFVLANVLFARFACGYLLAGLLTPLLAPVMAGAVLRTAWLGWRRDGIDWRGTRYTSAELRAGRRVRIPF
jgi:cellulose synthase/poly-beta-1,6-N-acetylglucosamine synthase-like glycosyltransferase